MAPWHHGRVEGAPVPAAASAPDSAKDVSPLAVQPQQPEVTRAEQQFCFRSQVSCLLSPAAGATLLRPAA